MAQHVILDGTGKVSLEQITADTGLPSQTGNSGKFLTTNGSASSWGTVAGSGDMVLASAQTNSGAKTFIDATLLLRNVANTFSGVFTNTITANRTWTLKDASGTIAFTSDITGTNSGTNTGDQTSIVGITGTKAQFNTSVTDGDIQFVGDAPTAHTHLLAAGATDVTITAANLNALDDGLNTTLHFHDADRARANHTGTQAAGTITGLASVATSGSAADLTGNLAVARLNSGTGATATTYWCGDGTWKAAGSVSGVSAVLIATQANSTVTPATLTNHSFTLPAGKTMLLNGNLIATAAATTTGIVYGVKVTNPTGANGNVQGSLTCYVNIASTAVATGLMDGDIFNVAANANATLTVIGSASTAGNNAATLQCMLKNQSTNTDATVEVVFASEVATSAVTAQIGTCAAGIIF